MMSSPLPPSSDVELLMDKSSKPSCSAKISNAVLPLVHPECVSKSTRNPNRGLYPRKRLRNQELTPDCCSTFSSSAFSKASDLYNNRRLDANAETIDQHIHHEDRLNSDRLNSTKSDSFICHVSMPVFSNVAFDSSTSSEDVGPSRNSSAECRHQRKRRKVTKEAEPKNTIHKYFPNSTFKTGNVKAKKSVDLVCSSKELDVKPVIKNNNISAQALPASSSKNDPVIDSDSGSQMSQLFMENDDSYYFGLFGSTDECEQEEAQPNYFEWLPLSVMEQIFFDIPYLDLFKLRLVSKQWNEVISNKNFLEWKKAYYRYKIQGRMTSRLYSLVKVVDKAELEDCFPTLIRFMSSKFNKRAPSNMIDLLRAIPKCADAEKVIAERMPKLASKDINAWSLIAAITLLSETVEDVSAIFKRLLYFGSPCSFHDVLEAMYCIATSLLMFIKIGNMNHGLHYRVYYAIYLLENAIPRDGVLNVNAEVIASGQQSMHSYCKPLDQRLTYEQIRILNHRLRSDQVVKIVAFAGTGKTTTLIHFTRLYPQLQFLTVMFNKSTCEHASKCFPANVECRTAHSLAFQAVGKQYGHKFNTKLKPHDVISHIDGHEAKDLHKFTVAKLVLETINNFAVSADSEITLVHVPRTVQISGNTIAATRRDRLSDQQQLAILNESIKLWSKMIDKSERECRITHDIYLKLFQLSKPTFLKYNCIMIDEAQDCNGAMLDIMLSQKLPVILVGDPHQQIYGFRGALSALQSVVATHTYHLTKSFRFGPQIAYVASCCLETLKYVQRDTLVGCEKESYVNGQTKGQYAVISRTNSKLFEEAVRLCCTRVRRSNEPEEVQAAFAGKLRGYGFDQLVDIYRLSSGFEVSKISDKFIKKFKAFNELRNYAKYADDSDLTNRIDTALRYGEKIIQYVQTIKKKGSHSIELANVVFSTAHKSKGLEFDTVCLTNDYFVGGVPCEKPHINSPLTEEFNILYVALTRAKQCLLLCEPLYKVLLLAQEKFEYPVPSRLLMEDSPIQKCVNCSSDFTPHTSLVLFQRATLLATGREIKGGPLCMKCATIPKYRPQVHHAAAIILLDFVEDIGHRSMASLVGPLPTDPPIVHDGTDDHNNGQQYIAVQLPHIVVFPLRIEDFLP